MYFVMAAKACENDLLAIYNNVWTKESIFIGLDRLMSAGSIISLFSDINGPFNISMISSGIVLLRILANNVFDRIWPGNAKK